MNVLTVTRPVLRQVLREQRRRRGPILCPVGMSSREGRRELFLRPPGMASAPSLLLTVSDGLSPAISLPQGCLGLLVLGRDRRRGQGQGFVLLPSGTEPLQCLKIVGPGMQVLDLETQDGPASLPATIPQAVSDRWSRTIAALGVTAWQRLTRLSYAIAGVGRTGSVMAQALAAGWGVERLTLIDPDTLEAHNLGEMTGVRESDLGCHKATALAGRLQSAELARPIVTAVTASITHLQALRAVQACDVLIGCLDHDGARWAANTLAALYCKPYLDVATGIHGEGGRRRLGADVRLVLPGGRCLLCLGGLADPAGAREVLTSADAEQAAYAARDWRRERAGSLRSLNHLAAALAQRLWEDFVIGRVTDSTWIHLAFDERGRMEVGYPSIGRTPACRLCALQGLGYEGLSLVSASFRGGLP
jgi:hypothetical protein